MNLPLNVTTRAKAKETQKSILKKYSRKRKSTKRVRFNDTPQIHTIPPNIDLNIRQDISTLDLPDNVDPNFGQLTEPDFDLSDMDWENEPNSDDPSDDEFGANYQEMQDDYGANDETKMDVDNGANSDLDTKNTSDNIINYTDV
ncbi:MAG: hypothetical protein ACRC0J_01165, partial [Shewanella oncorhynchi]